MLRKVSFSNSTLTLPGVLRVYEDTTQSLRLYFSASSPVYEVRFSGYTLNEVYQERREIESELDIMAALNVMSAIESALRVDFLKRVYDRKKDGLSRHFRAVFRKSGHRVSLEEDILEGWALNYSALSGLIGDLRGAFKFRHWIAHGRYWVPKLGRKYEFADVYALAEQVHGSFPFYGVALTEAR
jgi:hypothetical protein